MKKTIWALLALDVAASAVLAWIHHRNRPHWVVEEVEEGVVHIYPTRDGIEHDIESDDCPCGPKVVSIQADNGDYGWSYEHHALDGREFRERGEGIPRDVVR